MPGRLHPRTFNISKDSKVWEVFNAQKSHGTGQNPDYHATGPGGEANLFCCDGRIMCGPPSKLWQPVLTAHLVAAPVVLFVCYEGQYLPDCGIKEFNLLVLLPCVMMVISLIALFLTAVTDPGVILRSQDPAIEDEKVVAQSYKTDMPNGTTQIYIDGFEVNLKHCRTCKVWRTPRTTHCHVCDNCVEGFDHHCPWVGSCIGERNYREFCWFIFATSIVLLYCVILSVYQIANDEGDVWHRMNKHWAAMVVACYGCLFSLFIEILSACHCCLLCQGVTTKEWYDLCPKSPCDDWPGLLQQFVCFAMLCSVCHKFEEYELRPEEGRSDPCDPCCKCKLGGQNRAGCCGSWFKVCCRPLPKRGWSMTDKWVDVFPHKVEWTPRQDHQGRLDWQADSEKRLRYTNKPRAEIAKLIAAGKPVPHDRHDEAEGWVPNEQGDEWDEKSYLPYPHCDVEMLPQHAGLPLHPPTDMRRA